MNKKTQIQKFREAARSIGADESEGRFDDVLRRVARHKPSPEAERSASGQRGVRNASELVRALSLFRHD